MGSAEKMAYRQKYPYIAQLWYVLKFIMNKSLDEELLNKTKKGKNDP